MMAIITFFLNYHYLESYQQIFINVNNVCVNDWTCDACTVFDVGLHNYMDLTDFFTLSLYILTCECYPFH